MRRAPCTDWSAPALPTRSSAAANSGEGGETAMALKRFTAGMAVGYVLGARAGTKRYDQMTAWVERAMESTAVSRVIESGRELMSAGGDRAMDLVKDRLQ